MNLGWVLATSQVRKVQKMARPTEAQTIHISGGGSASTVTATRISIQIRPRKRKTTTIRRRVASRSALPRLVKLLISPETSGAGGGLVLGSGESWMAFFSQSKGDCFRSPPMVPIVASRDGVMP